MVVLVHHQAYWSNLPNEDAMKTAAATRRPSRVVLVDTDDAGEAAHTATSPVTATSASSAPMTTSPPSSPSSRESQIRSLCRFNVGEDYPVFVDGFYVYRQTYAGPVPVPVGNKHVMVCSWRG
uniref:Uncharacterized protein n=1 Tax=Oryza meridionalis TaxID=40149 RepID=A0A0E0C2Y9_9ORYZ